MILVLGEIQNMNDLVRQEKKFVNRCHVSSVVVVARVDSYRKHKQELEARRATG